MLDFYEEKADMVERHLTVYRAECNPLFSEYIFDFFLCLWYILFTDDGLRQAENTIGGTVSQHRNDSCKKTEGLSEKEENALKKAVLALYTRFPNLREVEEQWMLETPESTDEHNP